MTDEHLISCLERVVIHPATLELRVSIVKLLEVVSATAEWPKPPNSVTTIEGPYQLQRSRGRLGAVLLPDRGSVANTHPAILKALALANAWADLLARGEANTQRD